MTEVVIVVRDGRSSHATREHMVGGTQSGNVLQGFPWHDVKVAGLANESTRLCAGCVSRLGPRGQTREPKVRPGTQGQTRVWRDPGCQGSPEMPHRVRPAD